MASAVLSIINGGSIGLWHCGCAEAHRQRHALPTDAQMMLSAGLAEAARAGVGSSRPLFLRFLYVDYRGLGVDISIHRCIAKPSAGFEHSWASCHARSASPRLLTPSADNINKIFR